MRLPIAAAVAFALACSGVAEAKPKAAAPVARSPGAMIAAANPMAVEAGLKILRAGGTAADAAVAVQATLGLVEPQSSGLGGGAFMVFYDGKTKQVTAYDGRETAPAAAGPDYFLKPDGAPLGFEAIKTGRSVGAPGAVAMLALAQKDHGKLAWKDLFGEAERLATDGFPVPGRLAAAASRGAPKEVAAYVAGAKQGDILKNPAYAATIRTLAQGGPDAFYKGAIAQAIAAKVAEGPISGALTAADIAAYKPNRTEALCRPYRVYIVCVPPAPSGGTGLLMALGIYQNTDIAAGGPKSEKSWFDFAEGQRLMYADRDQYVADPAFVPQPDLLDADYLKGRAALIGDKAVPRMAGSPPKAIALGPDMTHEAQGTSHFVIVDKFGNVVSITTTVESPFGSGRMVGGFILNNQLTDFSQQPKGPDGKPVANAVAAGKRPRSSMAPLIVLDRNRNFVMAVGSPGGNSIPAYNLKAVVGFLDWKLSLQDAVSLPNMIARGPGTQAEIAKLDPAVVQGLAARGIVIRQAGGEDSGLHGVALVGGKLLGAADPRREGVAKAP